MVNLLDRILGSTGQERTAALRDLGRRAEYYVPPELRGILGFAAEMTPSETLNRAAVAGGEMLAPGRTPMQRVGSAGRMLSETAGVAAPIAVGPRAGMTAAQSLQEGLLGFSMAADDAGRRFVERMTQPGPVPTMYSNPVGRADKPMTVFHGGPTKVTSPRATVDPEGLPLGFSVTGNKDIAQNYANMRGGGVVSEFSVDPSKYNPISEFELYQLQDDLEVKLGFDEGDLPEDVLLSELRSRGINAIEYPDPEFGTRIIDPSILSPTLPAPRNEAEAMAKQVLEMRAAGRAGDVTEEMMAATDPQYMFANTPLPMDEPSRMARARELGRDTPAYRGTLSDEVTARPKQFVSENPDVTQSFAGHISFADEVGLPPELAQAEGGNIMPLLVDPRGNTSALSGYEMLLPGAAIRSRFARFDPAFAHLRNLSAGVGGLGLLSGLYSQEDTQ